MSRTAASPLSTALVLAVLAAGLCSASLLTLSSSQQRKRVWTAPAARTGHRTNLTECPPGHEACYRDRYATPPEGAVPLSDLMTNECILSTDECDGIRDCGDARNALDDGFEGVFCQRCNNGAFLCSQDAKCIRQEYRCDGTLDCSDGSDERGCYHAEREHRGRRYSYRNDRYKCDDTLTTRWSFTLCDGLQDCQDASDEQYDGDRCVSRARKRVPFDGLVHECARGSVRCAFVGGVLGLLGDSQPQPDGPRAQRGCLPAKRVCDGWLDCWDGEDEKDCPKDKEKDKDAEHISSAEVTADGALNMDF